jgi:nitroreductase
MTTKVLLPHPSDLHDHVPQGLSVIDAVIKRKSIRRFLSTPVSPVIVRAILDGAARAPSGTNIQPWKVHVVTGAARERVSRAVLEAARSGQRSDEYAYIPSPLKEPYLSRRRSIGFELFRLYGIERTDLEGRKRAALRNFEFFGAPVGLFFAMERYLLEGSWLDCGMFMQNVMILAREYGLETCPQQAWCEYGGIVHKELGLSDDYIMLSGMALGFRAPDAPENTLRSERIPLEEFVEFHVV